MRLITFLGTGNYAETRYAFNGQECQTHYVAAALATFLQADEITVLATEQAYASHAQGLTEELERLQLPHPTILSIPSGGNTDELWQQFGIISEAVTAGNVAQVSFDITHGFRAQPFFAAAVINYLRSTLDTVPAMQAFYGEWRKDEATSPIWDISTFIGLLNWSSSLQSFMKTGHGAGLATLAKQENATIQKAGQGERPRTLASLADSIRAFSDNISTVRVPQIITGKERGSASDVLAKIAQSEAEVRTHFMPLFPVLEQLQAKLQGIPADSLFSPQGHLAMLELAKLYVSYERYPEAAIVLREGWVSLYAASDRNNQQLLEKCERSATECRWYEAESKATKGHADLLSKVRNDIQHGGFRPDPNPAQALIKNLGELLGAFAAKLGVTHQEGDYPENTGENLDNGNAGMSGGYLAALMIGEKATQGFEIVIEEIKNQAGQGIALRQRIDGRKFIVETNDQNLIVAVRSYLAVKQSFF